MKLKDFKEEKLSKTRLKMSTDRTQEANIRILSS